MALTLIQSQVSPGQKAKFILKTGKEIEGIIHEITSEYVSVYNNNEVVVVLDEFIGGWQFGNKSTTFDEQDDQEVEFSGLPEDTVVEKVEFDWEDSKTHKDITESTIPNISPMENIKRKSKKREKLKYFGIGSGAMLFVVIIAKLLKIL